MIKVKDFMIKNVFTIDGNEAVHKATEQMVIKKMKPEFAQLPIFFSYDFDANKELSLVRQSD